MALTRAERLPWRTMTICDVALEFLRRFCAGNVNALVPLLAEDLQPTGPLLECRSGGAYLDSLRDDPPEPCAYRIVSVTDSEETVAVFYDYKKPAGSVAVAQLFRFKDGQISKMFVVFDTAASR